MQDMQQSTPDDTLADILYSLQSQQYEPGGIFTIGGATGLYQLKSPFNTECEYTLVCVDTDGTSLSSFAFSGSNPSITAPPTTGSVQNYGAVALGSEGGNPLEGIVGFINSTGNNVYPALWVPMGRGAILYFYANPIGANTGVYCTIAFRRSYVHMLPERVRTLAPSTHSRPYSRRNIRMLDGLSKQYSGFDAQYPTLEGGHERYNHSEIPWEQDPKGANPNVAIRRRNR